MALDEARRTLIVLSVVVFLVLMGITIVIPSLPLYGEELGATEFMVGLLVGGYALARVILDIPAGYIGDRHGHKRMMNFGLALIAVSSVGAGLALNYYVLLLVRILEGVGSAFYVTSSVAVLAVASPPEKRGTFMSIFTGALLLGAVVGPIAGGLAAEAGLRWPFFLYAILAAIGLVLQFFLLPEGEFSAPKGAPSPVERKVRFMTASFLLVNLGVMSAFFLRGALNTIYPLYATERFDFRTSTIGLLFTVTALASMVTLFPAGRWADRSGRKAPFVLSLLLSSAFTPLFVVAWDLPGQMLAMVAYGLASGLTGPMAAWAVDLTPRERLGPAMGVFRLVGDLGWLGGPLLAGWTAEVAGRTSPWPFILPALFGVVVGAALLLADDPAARRKPAQPLPGPSTAPISEDPGGH